MYRADQNRYGSMQYNRCGKSGLKLPAVSLGLWHNFGTTSNFETMKAMCTAAFDSGITHFDLANNYGPVNGAAEENFGSGKQQSRKGLHIDLFLLSLYRVRPATGTFLIGLPKPQEIFLRIFYIYALLLR